MKDKYARRIKIINYLSQQIYLLDERAFKNNPNWENNKKKTDYLFWVAKKVLNSGSHFSIEQVLMGGMVGSQVITEGTIQSSGKYRVNYNNVLEKTVQKIYQRLKQQMPNTEEQKKITDQFLNEPDNQEYNKQFSDLRVKFSALNKDLIRERLRSKLYDYLRKKNCVE